ncbi:MAG: hypothetical protein R3C61_11145 [Bacteroidia bacterium]
MSTGNVWEPSVDKAVHFQAIKKEFYRVLIVLGLLFFAAGLLYMWARPLESRFVFNEKQMHILPRQTFAMEMIFEGITGRDQVSVSVMRKTVHKAERQAMLVVSAGDFWQSVEAVKEKKEGGWEVLSQTIRLPDDLKDKTLKVYCWNPASGEYYFADYQVVVRYRGKFFRKIYRKESP